jgi:hypothetical protein
MIFHQLRDTFDINVASHFYKALISTWRFAFYVIRQRVKFLFTRKPRLMTKLIRFACCCTELQSYSVRLKLIVTTTIFPWLVNSSTSSADSTFNAASEFLGACGRE